MTNILDELLADALEDLRHVDVSLPDMRGISRPAGSMAPQAYEITDRQMARQGAHKAAFAPVVSYVRDDLTCRLLVMLGDAWPEVLVWVVEFSPLPRLRIELRLVGATITMDVPRRIRPITAQEIEAACDRIYDAAECLA